MVSLSHETYPVLPEVESFLQGPLMPYYGESFHEPVRSGTLLIWDPSWHRQVVSVGKATAADVDLAVGAARVAFDRGPWWSTLTPSERQSCIWALGELVQRDREILAQLDSIDSGKPVQKTIADIDAAAAHLMYYAGWATKLEGRTYPVDTGGMLAYSVKEPVGVVGLITPWNYPLLMAVWKLAPALAAGNCIVLKPAEQTPLSAIYLTRLVEEAGFPSGVFNVLPGLGPEAGAPLVEHRDVDKIGFTGSVDVARSIIRDSVGNLKRVSLELGGKSPNIVFSDADLDVAIPGSVWAIFSNNGQSCTAGSRLYVERGVYEQVLEGLIAECSKITIGPALAVDGPDLGPLVSSDHLEAVNGWLDAANSSGLHAAVGGTRPDGLPDGGYYLAPTVLVGGDDSLPVCREEIFGPVVVVMAFDEIDEVVDRANDTDSGLAAGVWTRDMRKAHAIATRVRAGTVWVNSWGVTEPGVPFGGMKQSGHGREMGEPAIDLYSETKSVWITHGK